MHLKSRKKGQAGLKLAINDIDDNKQLNFLYIRGFLATKSGKYTHQDCSFILRKITMNPTLNPLNAIGYGIDDYVKMFALTENELEMNIVDCYSGASCFAKEMTSKKRNVIACDPLYKKSIDEIQLTIEKAQKTLLSDIKAHPEWFVFTEKQAGQFIADHTGKVEAFIEDLKQGLTEKRYIHDALDHFSFKEEQFDLALMSHYLFTYSDEFSVDFHVKTIQELTRIANEVRIFPLVTRESHLSPYVGEVAAMLQMMGLGVEIRGVPFEIQKNGNAMMRVWSASCSVSAHQKV